MAKDLPDPMRLRDVKYGAKTTDQERIQVAQRLEAEGRLAEALDLYLIANAEEPVAEMRRRAVREGRPILLLILDHAGRTPNADEWKGAGEKALADGRYREAYRCFTEAGDDASLEKVREHLPDFDIYNPQTKV